MKGSPRERPPFLFLSPSLLPSVPPPLLHLSLQGSLDFTYAHAIQESESVIKSPSRRELFPSLFSTVAQHHLYGNRQHWGKLTYCFQIHAISSLNWVLVYLFGAFVDLPSSVPPSFESFFQSPPSAPLPCSQLPPGISKPLFTFLAWSLGIRNFNIIADMELFPFHL